MYHKEQYFISDLKEQFFLEQRSLYAYDYNNRPVYKVKFTTNIHLSKKFSTKKQAEDALDDLILSDDYVNEFQTATDQTLKLADLVVEKITVIFDN